MSAEYEDYSATSRLYDRTRVAVGVDRILAWLAESPAPLQQQTVLDAGCGTGNYLHALHGQVGTLCGVDRNPGMLAKARQKLGPGVHFACASITAMPYADQRFDGVLCNQVVHHIDSGEGRAFPGVEAFFAQVYRILRPGRPFIVNTSSHQQCTDGFWWADLVPEAMQRIVDRLPSLAELHAMLERCGFVVAHTAVDRSELLQGKDYLAPEGPLDADWRAGESTWSLATEAELARALSRVRAMNQAGTMQDYLDQREALRHEVGQTTFICAHRPA